MVSHVELSGLRARFYDQLILIGTLGLYNPLIHTIIADMQIKPADKILDMGAGTGKNTLLMRRYLSDDGHITACEISTGMKKQFQKKCGKYKNITLSSFRIERPLPFRDTFDKVFLSFVIHGFTHDQRISILQNALNALKPGGRLFIFDWNEFSLEQSGPLLRLFMNTLNASWRGILSGGTSPAYSSRADLGMLKDISMHGEKFVFCLRQNSAVP